MVRTKSSAASVRVSGAKAPRKVSAVSGSVDTKKHGSEGSYSGGNPYHPRETPVWQKEITKFFSHLPNKEHNEENTSMLCNEKKVNMDCENTDVCGESEILQESGNKVEKLDEIVTDKKENKEGAAFSEVSA